MDTKTQYYPYIAFGIICLAIGLRLIGLDKGMWMDELYALDIARSGDFVRALRIHDYPPTYFCLLRLWSSLNASEPFLRLLSVTCGMLTLVVVMAWVKAFSPSASLISGFLVATAPMLLRYSQEIQAYPLLLFAVACAFYCAHRISSDDAGLFWYCCLTAALCVAVTTHMVGIMILPSVCIYLLPTLWRRRRILRWTRLIVTFLIPVVVFGLSYYLFAPGGKAGGWWMPPLSFDLMVKHFKQVFGIYPLMTPVVRLGRYHPVLAVAYRLVVASAIALFLGCLTLLGKWRRSWMLFAAVGVFWLQIVLFSLVFLPIFWNRIILPGVIPLVAFAGLQATTIRRKAIGFAAAASLALVSLLSAAGWVGTEARVPYEGWRQLGRYLEANYQPGNLVAFYPSYVETPTTYYFAALRDSDAIGIALGTSAEAIDQELARHMSLSKEEASAVVLFLVVRYDDSNVEKDSVAYRNLLAYLESSALYTYPRQDFGSVMVLQYELPR